MQLHVLICSCRDILILFVQRCIQIKKASFKLLHNEEHFSMKGIWLELRVRITTLSRHGNFLIHKFNKGNRRLTKLKVEEQSILNFMCNDSIFKQSFLFELFSRRYIHLVTQAGFTKSTLRSFTYKRSYHAMNFRSCVVGKALNF